MGAAWGRRLTAVGWRSIGVGFQVAVALIFVVGVLTARVGLVFNAGVALLVMALPAVLARRQVFLGPGLRTAIGAAVTLHAVGIYAGWYRPGSGFDHLTHGLSAAVVATVGAATLLAIDRHSPRVSFPGWLVAMVLPVWVTACGVGWELAETALVGLRSVDPRLTVIGQAGLGDTMADLLADILGGLAVAAWRLLVWRYRG